MEGVFIFVKKNRLFQRFVSKLHLSVSEVLGEKENVIKQNKNRIHSKYSCKVMTYLYILLDMVAGKFYHT